MARIRKEPNRYWSKEDKLKLINEVLNGKSSQEVARENNISWRNVKKLDYKI